MKEAKTSKTKFVSEKEALLNRKWYQLDAAGKNLGRFASEVAKILRGKHKPDFTPNIDTGDGVIVINAEKIEVTGAKKEQKLYRSYTGYVGGLRETPYKVMMQKKPTHALMHAIEGMMPKTRLGKKQLKKLRVYAGTEHGNEAQRPIAVNI